MIHLVWARRTPAIRINGRCYRNLAPIASSASSVLCRATRDDGREVVLKRRAGAFDDDEAALAEEYEVLAPLRHPAIVAALDFGADTRSGEHYLVMEHVQGRPLWTGIHAFDEADAMRSLATLVGVCEFLAQRGIAHCDIKPDNVLVLDDLSVRLGDFGAATPHGSPVKAMSPSFTAPEHLFGDGCGGCGGDVDDLAGEAAGPATDLFSLGVTWYWLLAGRHPYFPDGHPVVLGRDAYAARPAAPTALNPTLDEKWDACLLGLVDRDRQRRLATARRIFGPP